MKNIYNRLSAQMIHLESHRLSGDLFIASLLALVTILFLFFAVLVIFHEWGYATVVIFMSIIVLRLGFIYEQSLLEGQLFPVTNKTHRHVEQLKVYAHRSYPALYQAWLQFPPFQKNNVFGYMFLQHMIDLQNKILNPVLKTIIQLSALDYIALTIDRVDYDHEKNVILYHWVVSYADMPMWDMSGTINDTNLYDRDRDLYHEILDNVTEYIIDDIAD